jgi:hypothetical protein
VSSTISMDWSIRPTSIRQPLVGLCRVIPSNSLHRWPSGSWPRRDPEQAEGSLWFRDMSKEIHHD